MKVFRNQQVWRLCLWTLAIGGFLAAVPLSLRGEQAAAVASQAPRQAATPANVEAYRALVVDKYCVGCHNDRAKTANLSLQGVDLTNAANDPVVGRELEKVVAKLRLGAMPPLGMPRPDAATLDGFVTALESALDRAATVRRNPGRKETFHRLNRAEYQNAIRDVLGVTLDVSSLVPKDSTSFGFDNIAGLVKLSNALVERYAVAAEKIARNAVGSPSIQPTVVETVLTSEYDQNGHVEGLPLGSRGGALVRHWFPADAEYEIAVDLLQSPNGPSLSRSGFDEPHTIEVAIDGERVFLHTFPVRAPGAGRGPSNFAEAAERDVDSTPLVRVPVTAGPHEITVTFPKKSAAMSTFARNWFDVPFFSGAGGAGGGGVPGTGYRPALGSVRIAGPFNVTAPGDSPSRRRIFTCQPGPAPGDEACARQILTRLARSAYRRPVTAADIDPLMTLFTAQQAEGGGFERGIEIAIQRMLVSPHFLFRIERDPQRVPESGVYRLSDIDLASRLSFFLWSSVPDDALLAAAEKGTLQRPDVLRQQVRRMLADPKSEAFIQNFTGQWLLLRNLPNTTVDFGLFPDFEGRLRLAYKRETELFFADILRDPNASALRLLDADFTYVNERLARHYGIPGVFGEQFRKVSLANTNRPGGLLGHGSVLIATSYANRTAPTIRGKFILSTFLGTPPPEPPPNIPALPEAAGGVESRIQTVRERLAAHRRNPACAGCHNLMDPLGLALENFDAVGQWRDRGEDGVPIDASVVLFDGTPLKSPTDLRDALVKRRDNVLRTITERLMTYALGRGVDYYDYPAIRRIVRDARNQSLESLILGVVSSDPFQYRRAEQ